MSDRVCVGVVLGAHGVRGAVRVKSFTERAADLAAFPSVEDETGRRRFAPSLLSEGQKGVLVMTLDGVSGRTAAEALKGLKLWVPRAALPALEEEEYYYSDLIGLRAERSDGTLLGRVKGVFDFGGGDVIEITGPDGGMMVSFTRATVPVVDIAGGRLVVDPPAETEARSDGEQDGVDDGE